MGHYILHTVLERVEVSQFGTTSGSGHTLCYVPTAASTPSTTNRRPPCEIDVSIAAIVRQLNRSDGSAERDDHLNGYVLSGAYGEGFDIIMPVLCFFACQRVVIGRA